jgi:3-hydroxyacyl-CoA dehydrogenase
MATQLAKIKVKEYRKKYFSPESAPDPRTVISRIRRGDLIGEKEGRIWYIYPDAKPSATKKITRLLDKFGEGIGG